MSPYEVAKKYSESHYGDNDPFDVEYCSEVVLSHQSNEIIIDQKVVFVINKSGGIGLLPHCAEENFWDEPDLIKDFCEWYLGINQVSV